MQRGLNNLFVAEWLKLRATKIWMVPLLILLPLAYNIFMLKKVMVDQYQFTDENQWLVAMMMFVVLGGSLFYPFISAMLTSHINRIEDQQNSWKIMLTLPYTWSQVYLAKIIWLVLLALMTQVIFLIGLITIGKFMGLDDPILWQDILFQVFLGWIGLSVLNVIQFWISYYFKNSITPIVIGVILSIPVFILAESSYGFVYPWAMPVLGMNGNANVPFFILITIVYTLLFGYGGAKFFIRKGT
ncbi:ABC transporter permease [Hazenella sp. IB182357]|uniref:ABC transporter permease n=1 Tax=Polycladospora coralii TaxID=2771432 RepID=A0A926N5T9_9BACL|nr:ABC transporter permease [Polycladospora coralii]MBD1372094.1 ABC transporter permease [Polycladospora coralii]